MIEIDIKGEIVNSGSEWIYDWYGIQATSPQQVINKLRNANGQPVLIKISSGGGNVFAGCEIYDEIKNYKGKVTIEITGICASIAGVIAMAAETKMSPLAQFMMHNVSTSSEGDYRDMEHTAEVLKKANKTIANAFIMKTGLKEEEIKNMMDKETWLTAEECKELGLIDEIMYTDEKVDTNLLDSLKNNAISFCNSIGKVDNKLINQFKDCKPLINHSNKSDDFFIEKNKTKLKLLNLRRTY